MNQQVTTSTASFMDAMSSNINVGMNEVVSVFVAKYEDGLFKKKDELALRIKALKRDLADLDSVLKGTVNQDQYNITVPLLGLKSKVQGVEIVWKKEKYGHQNDNTIYIAVGVFDQSSERDYPVFTKQFQVAITASNIAEHKEASELLEAANGEMIEVMTQIKAVSRKERQIRGRISEMKLEQSGFSELMNNPEMLQLISVE